MRSRAWAVLLAAVLVSTGCTSGKPHATATTSRSATTSTSEVVGLGSTMTTIPAPSDMVVLDSTWITNRTGWVLGTVPASPDHVPCGSSCFSLQQTTDGGTTWRNIAAFPAGAAAFGDPACGATPCISRIRFANAKVGYAFGPSLLITLDGGRTWRQQTSPIVLGMEISGNDVVRDVTDMFGCPGPCKLSLEMSGVGSSTWHKLTPPRPSQNAGAALFRQGPRIYFTAGGNPAGGAGNAQTDFATSADDGATWRAFGDPCGTTRGLENDARSAAAAAGDVLVVLCQPRTADNGSFVRLSRDAGKTFGPRRALPVGASAQEIAAGDAATIVAMALGTDGGVFLSTDGGTTWRETLHESMPDAGSGRTFMGFQDSRTARVSFGGASLWTTTDGCRTWVESEPFATA